MANVYDSNPILIDTISSDIDIANLAFGLSDAPIKIKKVHFYTPTAGDKLVLRDKANHVVVELRANSTEDVSVDYSGDALRCQGLKLVTAQNTMTTGNVLITVE